MGEEETGGAATLIDQSPGDGGTTDVSTTETSTTDGGQETGGASTERSAAPEWVGELPEDLRGNPNFTKYADREAFLRGHLEQVSLLGKKGLERPADDAEPEVWNAFWQRVGRPESADGYAFEAPEGIELDEERLAEVRQQFHAAGLTQTQFDAVMGLYASEIAAQADQAAQQQVQMREETMAHLSREWGEERDGRIRRAGAALAKHGLVDDLKAAGLGNSALALRLGDILANATGEDTIDGPAPTTASAIDAQIAALKKDPDWDNTRSPRRAELRTRYTELMKRKYAG